MVVKEYMRCEPGTKPHKVKIVMANIAFYAPYTPRNAKGELIGESDEKKTVFCLNNGAVLLCDVPVKTVDQTFSSMK